MAKIKTENKGGKLVAFRRKLEEQELELASRISATVEEGRESAAEAAPDAVDQAVSTYQTELLYTRGTHEHSQLQQVRQAIGRINEGNFGECVECGEEIGTKRLEALPWTPYCIHCQEKLERKAS